MEIYNNKYNIYQIEEITDRLLIRIVNSCAPLIGKHGRRKGQERYNNRLSCSTIRGGINRLDYVNVHCAFDIETTREDNVAFMYVWQFGIGDNVIMGDTWEQFEDLLLLLEKCCDLSSKRKLLVFIVNQQFEFNFLKFVLKRCKFTNALMKSEHTPLTFDIDDKIFFMDAYQMTGVGLDKFQKNYDLSIGKLKGDLDYNVKRYSRKDLTSSDLAYCYNDVLVVTEWARVYVFNKLIKELKHDRKIPITATGLLRADIYNNFIDMLCKTTNLSPTYIKKNIGEFNKFFDIPDNYEKYEMLMNYTYMGGVSKAFNEWVGLVIKNILSFDITSSYLFEMFSKKFPMFHVKHTVETFEDFAKLSQNGYSGIVTVAFKGLKVKNGFSWLPTRKALYSEHVIEDNKKIFYAHIATFALTDVDAQTVIDTYDYDKAIIIEQEIFKSDYLPLYFTKSLEFPYIQKAILKENGQNYTVEKAKVNSGYGITVQRLVVDNITFIDGEFTHSKKDDNYDVNEIYDKYRDRTLLSPYWGVWVSAYARRHLLKTATDVINAGGQVGYTDTDSLKIKGYNDAVKNVIDNDNANSIHLIKAYCERANVPQEYHKYMYGKDGLGQWQNEYKKGITRFKTLGAKRYIMDVVKNDGTIKYIDTIAGLPKNKLVEIYGADRYDYFKSDLTIKACGKLTHKYVDEPRYNSKGELIPSCILLDECDFTLDIQDMYIEFIKNYCSTPYEQRII